MVIDIVRSEDRVGAMTMQGRSRSRRAKQRNGDGVGCSIDQEDLELVRKACSTVLGRLIKEERGKQKLVSSALSTTDIA